MARCLALWQCGLLTFLACFPRLASSFLACPVFPATPWTTSRSCSKARTITAVVGEGQESGTPPPLPPHLDRSAPPAFIANNNVSLEGEFIVSKEGEATAAELANENLIKILAEKCTDEQINWLVWKCLGYRYDTDQQAWAAEEVFPLWKEKYPEPPDLLGVTRVYEKEVDQPVMGAVKALIKAIPLAHKRSIVEQLKPLGFSGLKLDELTPNRTRRAQATNFMLYYRDNLWGVSLEELRRRRQERLEKEAAEKLSSPEET